MTDVRPEYLTAERDSLRKLVEVQSGIIERQCDQISTLMRLLERELPPLVQLQMPDLSAPFTSTAPQDDTIPHPGLKGGPDQP